VFSMLRMPQAKCWQLWTMDSLSHTQSNPIPYASHDTSRVGQPLGTADYDFHAVFSSMHIWQEMASPILQQTLVTHHLYKRSVKDEKPACGMII